MSETVPKHAGVNFPPPFVYLLAIAAAWMLNLWVVPLDITHGTSPVRVTLGIAGVVAWLAIFLSALAAFRRHKTTLRPNAPASAVVTEGPYRFTRNPMYVSLVALYFGLALLLNTWWAFILLPLVLVIIQRTVIAREEEYLRAAFPGDYERYACRVRRWL